MCSLFIAIVSITERIYLKYLRIALNRHKYTGIIKAIIFDRFIGFNNFI